MDYYNRHIIEFYLGVEEIAKHRFSMGDIPKYGNV
jgi:hypothetical protein